MGKPHPYRSVARRSHLREVFFKLYSLRFADGACKTQIRITTGYNIVHLRSQRKLKWIQRHNV